MTFKKTTITFEETGAFSKEFTDYIKGEAYLTPFYKYQPTLEGFKKAIEDQSKFTIPRTVLVDALKNGYGNKATEATANNITSLLKQNTFTVTTGHQLCLFTGPLYFIYKIVTAINLAERLKKEYHANNFVPVFWMPSEDHDFAEINHTYVFGKKIEWSGDALSGGPVGKIPLDTLTPVLENLLTVIGESEKAVELKKMLVEAYSGKKTLADATFDIANAIFGKYGLVILDADNKELKKIFIPVIKDELLQQNANKLVTTTDAELAKHKIEPQIFVREINLFYMNEQGRNRIEKKGDSYSVIDTDTIFTKEQILAEAENNPERFSPNVILRPVYQQMILPNIAYIGGPSEVVYWLQLKQVFDFHKALYPVVMPRNFAMLIDKGTATKLEKFKLHAKDIFQDTEELIKGYVLNNDGGVDFTIEKDKLKAVYDEISEKVKTIDITLTSLVEAELHKQYNALKAIETKLIRAQKQKDETSVNQIRKIKEKLFPEGSLQERHDSFIPFYLQYGNDLFDMLIKELDPFEYKMAMITEQ